MLNEQTREKLMRGMVASAARLHFEQALEPLMELKKQPDIGKRLLAYAHHLQEMDKDYGELMGGSANSPGWEFPGSNVRAAEAIERWLAEGMDISLDQLERITGLVALTRVEKRRDGLDGWDQITRRLRGLPSPARHWVLTDNTNKLPFSVGAFPWVDEKGGQAGLNYWLMVPESRAPTWDVQGFSEGSDAHQRLTPLCNLAISWVTGVPVASLPPAAAEEMNRVRSQFCFRQLYYHGVSEGLSHTGALLVLMALAYADARLGKLDQGVGLLRYSPSLISIEIDENGHCRKVGGLEEKLNVTREEWGNARVLLSRENEPEARKLPNLGASVTFVGTADELLTQVLGSPESVRQSWLLSISPAEMRHVWTSRLTPEQLRAWQQAQSGLPPELTSSRRLGGQSRPVWCRLRREGRLCELRLAFTKDEVEADQQLVGNWVLVIALAGADEALWPAEASVTSLAVQVIYRMASAALESRPGKGMVAVHFLSCERPSALFTRDEGGLKIELLPACRAAQPFDGKMLDRHLRTQRESLDLPQRGRYLRPMQDYWRGELSRHDAVDAMVVGFGSVPDARDDTNRLSDGGVRPFASFQTLDLTTIIQNGTLTQDGNDELDQTCGLMPFKFKNIVLGLGRLAPLRWSKDLELLCTNDDRHELLGQVNSRSMCVVFDRASDEPVDIKVAYTDRENVEAVAGDRVGSSAESFLVHDFEALLAEGQLDMTSLPPWGSWSCPFHQKTAEDPAHMKCHANGGRRGSRLWIEPLESVVSRHCTRGIIAIDQSGGWKFARTQIQLHSEASAVVTAGGVLIVKADGSSQRPEARGSDAHRHADKSGEWLIFTV